MNFYYDTEFLEGTQDKKFLGFKYGTTSPTIDLISIGIVSEDGREYYAISKDFNLKEAWNRYDEVLNRLPPHDPTVESEVLRARHTAGYKKVYWIRENVLKPMWVEKCKNGFTFKNSPMTPHGIESLFTYSNFKKLIKKYGKSNKQITEEVRDFCNPTRKFDIIKPITVSYTEIKDPVLYGYYSAYDHVALCWLFGKMIDLPKGFPMYTIDLKQMMDEYVWKWKKEIDDNGGKSLPFDYALDFIKCNKNYPKQGNEHNALSDARWNKKLHEFLIQVN